MAARIQQLRRDDFTIPLTLQLLLVRRRVLMTVQPFIYVVAYGVR